MSTSETALLNPSNAEDDEPYLDSLEDDTGDIPSLSTLRKRRDPLYLLILYGLSSLVSTGALGCTIWGYLIVITAPFDGESKKMEREGYERYFLGMQSIIILNTINILWSGFNFHLALRGLQQNPEILWLVNMAYDFFAWAMLIAFGVLNMIEMLFDRRLCDGLPRQGDPARDRELYAKCDNAMFRLLVVEMVAVNLGLLVAVLHFILLIARCCNCGAVSRHWELRQRILEEEYVLMVLIERRQRLMEEDEELEARRERADRPLPPLPTEPDGVDDEVMQEDAQQEGEDLIDIVGDGREGNAHATDEGNVE